MAACGNNVSVASCPSSFGFEKVTISRDAARFLYNRVPRDGTITDGIENSRTGGTFFYTATPPHGFSRTLASRKPNPREFTKRFVGPQIVLEAMRKFVRTTKVSEGWLGLQFADIVALVIIATDAEEADVAFRRGVAEALAFLISECDVYVTVSGYFKPAVAESDGAAW